MCWICNSSRYTFPSPGHNHLTRTIRKTWTSRHHWDKRNRYCLCPNDVRFLVNSYSFTHWLNIILNNLKILATSQKESNETFMLKMWWRGAVVSGHDSYLVYVWQAWVRTPPKAPDVSFMKKLYPHSGPNGSLIKKSLNMNTKIRVLIFDRQRKYKTSHTRIILTSPYGSSSICQSHVYVNNSLVTVSNSSNKGGVAQWVARLTRNRTAVSSNPINVFRCFFLARHITFISNNWLIPVTDSSVIYQSN